MWTRETRRLERVVRLWARRISGIFADTCRSATQRSWRMLFVVYASDQASRPNDQDSHERAVLFMFTRDSHHS